MKLDDDEKGICSVKTHGGDQEVSVITESGLYALALRCRDAMTPGSAAYRFRKWVTAEVLPSIRKTGGYGLDEAPIARIAGEAAVAATQAMLLALLEAKIACSSMSAITARGSACSIDASVSAIVIASREITIGKQTCAFIFGMRRMPKRERS